MAVQNRTSTVTINAAFLQEIKEVHEDLWKLLEDVRQVCSDAHNVRECGRRVADLMGNLRDQLALHFALEEAYGYFEDPVRAAPHLSDAARVLRDEHEGLYATVRDLADDLEEQFRAGKLGACAEDVVKRFGRYHDQLKRHEARENELILEAYDDDLGVGD